LGYYDEAGLHSFSFIEILAGMLDDSDNFAGVAAREIEEEVGFKLEGKDLIDLTKLTLEQHKTREAPHDTILELEMRRR
jgi:ADP-sugar diphosphatase